MIDVIRQRCVLRGNFLLSGGSRSSTYVDLRRFTMRYARDVATAMLELLADAEFDSVGGMAVGAVPVVAAICFARGCEGFYVRREAKQHGALDCCTGTRAVIVDDVATSGNSLLVAALAARAAGCEVRVAAVIVDREEGAAGLLHGAGIQLRRLYTLREVLRGL